VGRFSDNLSPTFSPDGQRMAFVSTRRVCRRFYVMAADGTDQQLFRTIRLWCDGSFPTRRSGRPTAIGGISPGRAGTLQVFVLDVRTRTVRQLTSVGRNEDPTWAPDSRHLALCIRPVGLTASCGSSISTPADPATAAAERGAFAGLVSTAFGGPFYHPLIGETG